MKKSGLSVALLALALFAAPRQASAAPLVPFCPGGPQSLPAANFGGSGIPNNAVCTATIGEITFGFTATARFANSVVTNNGLDTFSALAGDDTVDGQPNYAIWNFDWFIRNNSTVNSYTADVLWDTNAAANTDVSQFGHLAQALAPGVTLQNSWNLGMGFIDTGAAFPGIYSPAAGLFSPYAGGQYGFAVNAFAANGQAFGIGAFVNVNNVGATEAVPEPASLALLGTGLLGLAAATRRARRR